MSEKVVVIISTGRQDIKLWAQGLDANNEQHSIVVPIGGQIREFHCRMREEKEKFYILNTADKPEVNLSTGDGFLGFDGKSVGIKEKLKGFKEVKPINGTNPPYNIYPAKIINLVDELIRLTVSKQIIVQAILLFLTERDPLLTKYGSGEPIANGDVLGPWLASKFNLSYKGEKEPEAAFNVGEVNWVNMLKDLDDFSGKGLDSPIHRRAAYRIDTAISGLADGNESALALVSDTGGFGEIKPLIKASVRLRFRNKIIDLPDTETTPLQLNIQQSLEETQWANCIESVEARHHCEQRLWQGDFIGAWGTVAHLQQNLNDQPWIKPVKQLADFFIGATLESEQVFPELQQVMDSSPALLRSAFKVEAALQGIGEGDRKIAEAVLGTANFYDLSLRLKINQQLSVLQWVQFSDDEMEGKVKLLSDLPNKMRADEKFFIRKNKETYLLSLGRGGDEYWVNWLKEQGYPIFHDYFIALTRQNTDGKALRTYRNYVAHRILSHSDAQAARQLAEKMQLWAFPSLPPYDAQSLGQHFLNAPYTVAMLHAFDLEHTAQQYRQLMKGLLGAVRSSLQAA